MIVAEGVKFLVTAVLAINYQGLVIQDIVALPQIFKDGRHPGLEAFGEKLVRDVFVLFVFARNDVKRALPMAGVHADGWSKGIDLHPGEECAAFGEVMAQKGGVSGVSINGFAAPRPAAEANNNHVRSPIGRLGGNRGVRQQCSAEQ